MCGNSARRMPIWQSTPSETRCKTTTLWHITQYTRASCTQTSSLNLCLVTNRTETMVITSHYHRMSHLLQAISHRTAAIRWSHNTLLHNVQTKSVDIATETTYTSHRYTECANVKGVILTTFSQKQAMAYGIPVTTVSCVLHLPVTSVHGTLNSVTYDGIITQKCQSYIFYS